MRVFFGRVSSSVLRAGFARVRRTMATRARELHSFNANQDPPFISSTDGSVLCCDECQCDMYHDDLGWADDDLKLLCKKCHLQDAANIATRKQVITFH